MLALIDKVFHPPSLFLLSSFQTNLAWNGSETANEKIAKRYQKAILQENLNEPQVHACLGFDNLFSHLAASLWRQGREKKDWTSIKCSDVLQEGHNFTIKALEHAK